MGDHRAAPAPWTPSPKGGQPRLDDRKALTGILFVLKTGIPWEDLPCEMGCGCGMTCWRRLRDWQADGTWDKIHKVLLDRLRGADKIDWSQGADRQQLRAGGLRRRGDRPQPGGPGQAGSKHHVITDANGIPLASSVTAANVNDVTELAPLFNSHPAGGGQGRATRGRSPTPCRGTWPTTPSRTARGCGRWASSRCCPRRRSTTRSGLGETRWPVERTLAWVHQNRRLRIRYERRPDIHQAFLTLACIKICASALFAGFC